MAARAASEDAEIGAPPLAADGTAAALLLAAAARVAYEEAAEAAAAAAVWALLDMEGGFESECEWRAGAASACGANK